MKTICCYWLDLLLQGKTELDFKKLRLDRRFMVYVTQAYPSLKPYLKGFHLSLETWRGDRDHEGWRVKDGNQCTTNPDVPCAGVEGGMEDIKNLLLTQDDWEDGQVQDGSESGLTTADPRFWEDLEAILQLCEEDQPLVRRVRSSSKVTAYYGFGDASSGGFGATVERPGGIHGRFGLWGRDDKDKSSTKES
jgi:hypothetical protein